MRGSSTPAAALLCLALPALAQEPADAPETARGQMTVQALANEGFLLSGGGAKVLIDAFVRESHAGYDRLSGEVLRDLEEARGPFEGVALALASHYHRDHFQAEVARSFLQRSPSTLLVSSPQVLADLLRPGELELSSPPRALLPEPGEEESVEHGGAEVTILRLSHGTGRFQSIENLGHLITLDGVTALHVGDAAVESANFAPYGLPERGIDVALIPFWYFRSPAGLALVEEHFKGALLVPCHLPSRDLDAVAAELAHREDVRLLRRPLETLVVRAGS